MYCITYSNVYYMETCLKLIHFQGSSDSTTFRLCSIIRTSNYIQHPVHLHFHKYYYHAYNGLTVHQSDFFSPPPQKKEENYLGTEMPIQQWNITATVTQSLFIKVNRLERTTSIYRHSRRRILHHHHSPSTLFLHGTSRLTADQ